MAIRYKAELEKVNKQHHFVTLGLSTLTILFGLVAAGSIVNANNLKSSLAETTDLKNKFSLKGSEYATMYSESYSALSSCNQELQAYKDGKVFRGKVSYYSHAGCIGCSPTQTMANGQPFDENAMTLAFNKAPLNTVVTVKNLDNGKEVVAKVTDRHGADNAKYGYRLADLSLGLCKAIDCKTDKSNIEIIVR